MTKLKRHYHKKKPNNFFSTPNLIVIVATGLLIISVLAEIIVPTYKTNPLLYGLMGTIVGLTIRSMNK